MRVEYDPEKIVTEEVVMMKHWLIHFVAMGSMYRDQSIERLIGEILDQVCPSQEDHENKLLLAAVDYLRAEFSARSDKNATPQAS